MDAQWKLQKAIYQRLMDDPALQGLIGDPAHIFDDPPKGADYPYIVIGETKSTDWPGVEGGLEHDIRVHAFSRYAGRREIKQIQSAVYDVLHDVELSLDGLKLVNLRFIFADVLRRTDGDIFHGVSRFRAVTAPLAEEVI